MRKFAFAVLAALTLSVSANAQTFEPAKDVDTTVKKVKVEVGGAFAQQFQGLRHSNAATPKMMNNVDANKLIELGNGFNLATANMYITATLAPGMKVVMTSYLSSRHHNEAWVKDGYFLFDASPINHPILNSVMKYTTLKVGHYEIGYGDLLFRRSDNGNTINNPFVGNPILDAMTTEVGGEALIRKGALIALAGISSGENKGNLQKRAESDPAYFGKIGFDKSFSENIRTRLTVSKYSQATSPAATLFAGDRAGSRYYQVMENTASTLTGNFTSGLINPGFRKAIHTTQINPFVKLGPVEAFGAYEVAKGRAATETTNRKITQLLGDVVLRGPGNKVYLAARHNEVTGELSGITNEITIKRQALAAGWFVLPGLLLKSELVDQKYLDFPTNDIRHKGQFRGFVIEGAVAF